MSYVEKAQYAPGAATPKNERPKEYYRARPCGELDYKALVEDVKRRFPKILAHLAE